VQKDNSIGLTNFNAVEFQVQGSKFQV